MITISLVTMCHLTKNIVIDYIPHTERFTLTTLLFCNWKVVPLNLPHLFLASPIPPITTYLFSVSMHSVSSVTQSCPTPRDPMNCSMPGFPVHHQLPEFTQTHVHRVSDAIQPAHPLSSPSPPAPNPSQHQGLFQWVNSSHQVAIGASVQHQFLQWIFRTDFP